MKTVLIIDDNQVITSIYRGKLAAEGLHTEIASDGEQGLAMLERCRPDVVLLDLMLPKINGMDVLKQIRARAEYKALPVIVFSNSYSTDVMQRAWEFGATDVLHKSSTTPRTVVLALVRAIATSAPADTATVAAAAPGPDVASRPLVLDLLDHLASGDIETTRAEFLRVIRSAGTTDQWAAPEAKLLAALEVLTASTHEMAAGVERDAVSECIRSLSSVIRMMTARQKVAC
jgi:DNA-binding response OmpR family regulator